MKVFNKIIQSDAEPSRNNIWFKDKKLWFYNNNGWEALTDEVGKPADLTGYLKEKDADKIYAKSIVREDGVKVLKDTYSPIRFQLRDIVPPYPGFSLFSQVEYSISIGKPETEVTFYIRSGLNSLQSVWNLGQPPLSQSPTIVSSKNLSELLQTIFKRVYNGNGWDYILKSELLDFSYTEVQQAYSKSLPLAFNPEPSSSSPCTKSLVMHLYDGTRDMSSTATNIVQEKGLYTVINDFRDTILGDNGFINAELIPPHKFVNEYTKAIDGESVIVPRVATSSGELSFDVRILHPLVSDSYIESFLRAEDNGYIPNLINAGHLFMVANYLKNKIVAPDKVPVKAGAGVTVSKSDSDITIDIKGYDKLAKVAILNVGTTDEVKTHNQAQIPTDKTTFFVQIENGIGVAKFTTTGGSAVVTTGEGTRIKYNIGPGYSCSKDTEYFEVTDLVYTMSDIALTTLDSTTNMASLLTDEQADQMFKCSYIKFNLKKMSGEHVLGTLPITCSCSSLGFSEKVFQTPTLSIGNTDFTNIKITVKKMTPEGGTEEHWYAVLETV